MKPILVVGGGSRSGVAFRDLAAREGRAVTVLARRSLATGANERLVVVEDYFAPPQEVFDGAPVVVNFAGAPSQQTEAALWRLNADGPAALARHARDCGAVGFVQLSSLSIYGGARDIDAGVAASPASLYGRTKLRAEETLGRLETPTFFIVILRAPMIYAPGGGGKLAQLAGLWARTKVLPAPRTLEARSMVHVDNLAAAILEAIDDGRSRTAFATDHDPFDLLRLKEAFAMEGKAVSLLRLPAAAFWPLKFGAPGTYESLFGRSRVAPGDAVLPRRERITLADGLRQIVRLELARGATMDHSR